MSIRLSGDEIVILAVHNWKYAWYVSGRDYWVLVLSAWEKAFRDTGYNVPEAQGERFGLPIVDENNAGGFLRRMEPFKRRACFERRADL